MVIKDSENITFHGTLADSRGDKLNDKKTH
jgi:hypothetical protein